MLERGAQQGLGRRALAGEARQAVALRRAPGGHHQVAGRGHVSRPAALGQRPGQRDLGLDGPAGHDARAPGLVDRLLQVGDGVVEAAHHLLQLADVQRRRAQIQRRRDLEVEAEPRLQQPQQHRGPGREPSTMHASAIMPSTTAWWQP